MKITKILSVLALTVTIGFASCKKNDVDPTCIDRSKIGSEKNCTEEYNPVCGCDNVTYSNVCNARNAGVTAVRPGECGKPPKKDRDREHCGTTTGGNTTGGETRPCIDESKINRNAMCTKEYNPVCGCDGKTYGNECEATNAGVTSYKKGSCDGKR